jgi:hypothetical protein
MVMMSPDRYQAAEQLKNMMMAEKPSLLPKILAALVILGLLGAVGYWFYLPVDKKPSLDQLKDRAGHLIQSLVNTPIMGTSSKAAPAKSQKSQTSESSESLISTPQH